MARVPLGALVGGLLGAGGSFAAYGAAFENLEAERESRSAALAWELGAQHHHHHNDDAGGGAAGGGWLWWWPGAGAGAGGAPRRDDRSAWKRREEALRAMRGHEFDVLVIGGGATGAGCALDATTRGLTTALVGTSPPPILARMTAGGARARWRAPAPPETDAPRTSPPARPPFRTRAPQSGRTSPRARARARRSCSTGACATWRRRCRASTWAS